MNNLDLYSALESWEDKYLNPDYEFGYEYDEDEDYYKYGDRTEDYDDF